MDFKTTLLNSKKLSWQCGVVSQNARRIEHVDDFATLSQHTHLILTNYETLQRCIEMISKQLIRLNKDVNKLLRRFERPPTVLNVPNIHNPDVKDIGAGIKTSIKRHKLSTIELKSKTYSKDFRLALTKRHVALLVKEFDVVLNRINGLITHYANTLTYHDNLSHRLSRIKVK